MTIDQFTQEEFEDALPSHKATDEALWEYVGWDKNEHTYAIPLPFDMAYAPLRILIRSSIGSEGIAKDTGEDSIRMLLQEYDKSADVWRVLGKVDRYTTRVNGWQERMTAKLRELWRVSTKIHWCKYCNRHKHVYRVKKKTSEHCGRLFQKCPKCGGGFSWI